MWALCGKACISHLVSSPSSLRPFFLSQDLALSRHSETGWVMKPDSLYLERNPHQPQHSTQGQTQGGQATRRKDSSCFVLLHPLIFLEISQRTEHSQHTPSFWGHRSCLRGPHPKLRPPEQASTSLCPV